MRRASRNGGNQGASTEQQGSDPEHQEAEKRSSIGAPVVYRAVLLEGQEELGRSSSALAWSGLAAGLSMGFSLLAQAILRAHLTEQPWQFLISKLGYSVGFLVIVLGRQQLFTENTLTAVLPFLQNRTPGMLLNVLRLWSVVLLSNLVGSFLFAWTVSHTSLQDPSVNSAFHAIGLEAMEAPSAIVLIRAVFAGWLIALMVWLLPAAEAGKVPIIVILTYLIGIGHFNHIIAGSVDTLYLVVTGDRTFGEYLLSFALPTRAGNILGGVSLVALLGHAQVST